MIGFGLYRIGLMAILRLSTSGKSLCVRVCVLRLRESLVYYFRLKGFLPRFFSALLPFGKFSSMRVFLFEN